MQVFERIYKTMVNPWMVMASLALILLSFLYIDQPLAYYFHTKAYDTQYPWLISLSSLGSFKLYLGPLFLVALFFRYVKRVRRYEMYSWFLWLSVLIPSIVCTVLKIMLGRARPELLFSDNLYGFYGFHLHPPFWSFPSGHTTTIMGLMFGLSALFPRFCWLFILFGILDVMTRILLTFHYLSDVLVASYLALIQVGLLYHWFSSKKDFR